jgi:short subunit dehydrogenase-like uncharacterized protein
MERMQLEYHNAAEEKGVYAISGCGFDSVPADLGTVLLMNKFQGIFSKMPLLLLYMIFTHWFDKTTCYSIFECFF